MSLLKTKELLESQFTAAQAADLFLSPFVRADLFVELCREAGPTHWVVNRSDVHSRSLEILLKHPIEEIRHRAGQKLKLRMAAQSPFGAIVSDKNWEELSEYEVNETLGHPLASFSAIEHFLNSEKEDIKVTAALSLMRRLWEQPLQNQDEHAQKSLKQLKKKVSSLSSSDSSLLVRAYCARIPLLDSYDLLKMLKGEKEDFVLGRILQNEHIDRDLIDFALLKLKKEDLPVSSQVLALDSRLEANDRDRLKSASSDELTHLLVDL